MQHQALVISLIATVSIASAAPPPALTSPEVAPDRRIALRILAPKAQEVQLFSTDIFGMARQQNMTKPRAAFGRSPSVPSILALTATTSTSTAFR
jgi:hypothetical protein